MKDTEPSAQKLPKPTLASAELTTDAVPLTCLLPFSTVRCYIFDEMRGTAALQRARPSSHTDHGAIDMVAKTLPPQDYLLQCFLYDPETGALTWRARPREHFVSDHGWRVWNAQRAGAVAGTVARVHHQRYVRVTIDYKSYPAQRVIWKLLTGHDPSAEIDHKDGNGLNNVWRNLRLASVFQNAQNRTMKRSAPYKGVSFQKGRWASKIMAHRRLHQLGVFATAEAAHEAYKHAAEILHGQFANTK